MEGQWTPSWESLLLRVQRSLPMQQQQRYQQTSHRFISMLCNIFKYAPSLQGGGREKNYCQEDKLEHTPISYANGQVTGAMCINSRCRTRQRRKTEHGMTICRSYSRQAVNSLCKTTTTKWTCHCYVVGLSYLRKCVWVGLVQSLPWCMQMMMRPWCSGTKWAAHWCLGRGEILFTMWSTRDM